MDIIKRRQHYVPKTYLKPFSKSGRSNDIICAYFLKQKRIRLVAIDDVCVENYLYEHYICYDNGETDFISPNSIENGYMQLENEYRPIIEKIISNQSDAVLLTADEQNILTGFMSVMLFRHPIFINLTNALHEKVYAENKEWRKELSNKFPKVADIYFKMSYLHKLLEIQQDPNQSLIIQTIKSTFDDNQLCVFKSNSGDFITSDAPIVNVYGDINGVEYDLVGMPVSPEFFVAFIDIDSNVSNKVFTINDEQTLSLNKYQYSRPASGIIMSKSEDVLRKQCPIIYNG